MSGAEIVFPILTVTLKKKQKTTTQKQTLLSPLWPDSTCGAGGRWNCEQNACLIEADVIHAVNRGNYGYKSKYTH